MDFKLGKKWQYYEGEGQWKVESMDSVFQWDQNGWNTKEFSYVLQVQQSQVWCKILVS